MFVSDQDRSATLDAVRAILRPGGWLVFESRRPEVRDWESWGVTPTHLTLPDGQAAAVSRTVTDVAPPSVICEGSTTIGEETLRSTSTLRFRERNELESDLRKHGFPVPELREAPDRPGEEFVFVAQTL